jgi:cystathionine gamma-synthase
VVVDNTFATPLLQSPLALGADLVVHSATKFIGGHSDLLLGAVVARRDEDHARLVRRREVAGATPGALECFLALRGARTLALRLRHAQDSAGELAVACRPTPRSTGSATPGLPDDPHHASPRPRWPGSGRC